MKRQTDADYLNSLRNGSDQSAAVMLILDGALEAPHHQQWYLDQAIRRLAAGEYDNVIAAWESRTGETWDTGVTP